MMDHFRPAPTFRKPLLLMGLLLLAALVGGCESAKVTQTAYAGVRPKPDFIIVRNFAVRGADIKIDESVVASVTRDVAGQSQSDEEVRVGYLVADKLAQVLVDELRKSGIPAVREGAKVRPTDKTVILQGQFVTMDQGNQAQRVVVGFGLGGSKLRTNVQLVQAGQLVAAGRTDTDAGLKPGMLLSAGTGSAASLAVGAVSQTYSEAFVTTLEADASRSAKAVAKRIHDGYVERGWLAK